MAHAQQGPGKWDNANTYNFCTIEGQVPAASGLSDQQRMLKHGATVSNRKTIAGLLALRLLHKNAVWIMMYISVYPFMVQAVSIGSCRKNGFNCMGQEAELNEEGRHRWELRKAQAPGPGETTGPLGYAQLWCGGSDAYKVWSALPQVQAAWHVKTHDASGAMKYTRAPAGDLRPLYKTLASKYRMMIYSGDADGCVPHTVRLRDWLRQCSCLAAKPLICKCLCSPPHVAH